MSWDILGEDGGNPFLTTYRGTWMDKSHPHPDLIDPRRQQKHHSYQPINDACLFHYFGDRILVKAPDSEHQP